MTIVAALLIAVAIWYAATLMTSELKLAREAAVRERVLTLLTVLSPAIAAAEREPQAVLAWQPVAKVARALLPEESAALDRAAGGVFPFSKERLQAAHDRWTADWLAWERTHDAESKLKAAEAEEALTASGGSAIARGRLEAVEREKLERYQRRYAEYVRVAKALQGLMG